ncbi:MAG: DNRLRE domain-containing protein [Planctomycetota bacterium]
MSNFSPSTIPILRRKCGFTSIALATMMLSVVNSAWAETVSYRQGQDSGYGVYAGVSDTYIDSSYPDRINNTEDPNTLWVDFPTTQFMIAFDGIFGISPGQIPLGSAIDSATLTLYSINSGTSKNPTRMLYPWNAETLTWNNAKLGGNSQPGIQVIDPDREAEFAGNGPGTSIDISTVDAPFDVDITTLVQEWSDGAPNYGMLLDMHSDNALGVASSESSVVAQRPMLTVVYTVPEPSTGYLLLCGSLALVVAFGRKRPTNNQFPK